MTLTAKPIVKDQYWVVTDGDKKVGNVIAEGSGFNVKLNGTNVHYKNTSDLRRKTKIEFQTLKTNKTKIQLPFAIYPTTAKVYNSMFDVKRKLHLYTKTQKSKCYYAAGYYVINQNGQNQVIFCPKYIFIQRYPYIGPYKSETEANAMINSL
jgi:hypothetical protein